MSERKKVFRSAQLFKQNKYAYAEGGTHLPISHALRLPEPTQKTKSEGCVHPLRSGPLVALRFGSMWKEKMPTFVGGRANQNKSGQTPNNTGHRTPKSQSWRPVLPAQPKKTFVNILQSAGKNT